MDDAHDGSYSREPQLDDLIRLARSLNAHHVRYVLIGGFAVIAHGGARTTKDIDLPIDADPINVARVRDALQILEDKAVNDVADEDMSRYSVVRVADEIVVDLMARACGVDYADANRGAVKTCLAAFRSPWRALPRSSGPRTRSARPTRPTVSSSRCSLTRPRGSGVPISHRGETAA